MGQRKRQNPVKGLFFGMLAGAGASAVMDQYWALVEHLPGERPEQQPQEGGKQEEDEPSTQLVADKVSKAATGKEVPKENKEVAGIVVHYLTGTISGGLFGIISALRPRTGLLAGLVFGVLLWLFLDEMILRALRLAPDPATVPVEKHVEALGAHLVFGGTMAAIARVLIR